MKNRSLSAGIWLGIVSSAIGMIVLGAGALTIAVDPYGVWDNADRYVEYLNAESPEIIKAKLDNHPFDYALIGSSRFLYLDRHHIERKWKLDVINLSVSGASLPLNTLFAERVKHESKQFVYGFDCFMLNAAQETYPRERAKFKVFDDKLQEPRLYTALTSIFALHAAHKSIVTMWSRLRGVEYDDFLDVFDAAAPALYRDQILESFADNRNNKFSNFRAYDSAKITALGRLADNGDIFVILPKYFAWYKLFQHHNVEEEYFQAVRTLAHTSKGSVFWYYGVSQATMNVQNFDDNGWHFKPKVGRLIFDEVFAYLNEGRQPTWGTLLTSKNVDSVLTASSNAIRLQQFPPELQP